MKFFIYTIYKKRIEPMPRIELGTSSLTKKTQEYKSKYFKGKGQVLTLKNFQ